eukprot:5095175-Prymnesium_polylepis.1
MHPPAAGGAQSRADRGVRPNGAACCPRRLQRRYRAGAAAAAPPAQRGLRMAVAKTIAFKLSGPQSGSSLTLCCKHTRCGGCK